MKDFERRQQKNRILQLCYCFENIGLALYLDSLIGSNFLIFLMFFEKKMIFFEKKMIFLEENKGNQSFLQKIMLRKMTDQKLLLAADFFHTKA